MIKHIRIAFVLLSLFGFGSIVSAHVVVKPSTTSIGGFEIFSIGVPSEKAIGTVSLKLVLPSGLTYVTPNVKPGWKVQVQKTGVGETAVVSEIDWTEGYIPTGERDDFVFSARVPAVQSELDWKAYQTYEDGSVVSWDQTPSAGETGGNNGPYSVTAVTAPVPQKTDSTPYIALVLSVVAFVFALTAFNRTKK